MDEAAAPPAVVKAKVLAAHSDAGFLAPVFRRPVDRRG
jgi:hypothetical protein